MRPWENLGIVETIYEEDNEVFSSSSSSLLSQSLSSPTTLPHSRVEAWSELSGCETNVLIHVQGTSFRLHKDRLSLKSTYLRLQLTENSELTLSPPLKITPETFSLVVDFCYGAQIAVSPFNVAALRLAAELLQMSETDGDRNENLWQMTEDYLSWVISDNVENASIVLKSCLLLLPEAETKSFLVGRCLEALSLTKDGDGVDGCLDDVMTLRPEDFKIVVESMNRRFSCHDVIYKILDFYLEEQKVTEEEKTQLCNSIDCNKLSSGLLLHAIQNPRMPLRLTIRAMLREQLNTRSSMASVANASSTTHDASVRGGTAQIKAYLDATCSRIESLERELNRMRKLLDSEGERSVLRSGKSASFRYGSGRNDTIVDRNAISSASCRWAGTEESSILESCNADPCDYRSPKSKRNIAQRLIKGLMKSAFWVSNSGPAKIGANKGRSSAKEMDGRKARNEENAVHKFS